MKSNRPTSITVISWVLIVTSAINLISFYLSHGNALAQSMMAQSPLPVAVQYAIGYVGIAIQLVCAAAWLKGLAWGRALYIGWGGIGLAIGFYSSPSMGVMIAGAVVFAIIVFFLLRPAANAYFARGNGTPDASIA